MWNPFIKSKIFIDSIESFMIFKDLFIDNQE